MTTKPGSADTRGDSPEVRQRAIAGVLRVLRSPLRLISVPERQCAQVLADDYDITVEDLIQHALNEVRNA